MRERVALLPQSILPSGDEVIESEPGRVDRVRDRCQKRQPSAAQKIAIPGRPPLAMPPEVAGQNLHIELRWLGSNIEHGRALAQELVELKSRDLAEGDAFHVA